MSSRAAGARAASGALVAGVLALAAPVPALAQQPAPTATPVPVISPTPGPAPSPQAQPEPVIDRIPARRPFGRDAQVSGHLESGPAGAYLILERRRAGGEWRTIASKRTSPEGRVTFGVEDLRTSALYRLVYEDPSSGTRSYSDAAAIEVAAALRLRHAPRHPFAGRRLELKGSLQPAFSGRRVVIEERRDGRWAALGRARAGDGTLSFVWTPRGARDRILRVRFAGDERNAPVARVLFVRVFAPALATWYGPGLYGNGTACGRTLRPDTLGIAHRSLPCGTEVTVVYNGKAITLPVIDRGPYSGAEWDLTQEAAERLGFSGTDTVGTDT